MIRRQLPFVRFPGLMGLVVASAVASTPAHAFWKKQEFLAGMSTQKEVLRSLEGWRFEAATTEQECVDQLLGTKHIQERARRGRGSIGSSHVALWKYCAATYLPSDTADECRTSTARYRSLASRDRAKNAGIVRQYLTSFCK